MNYEVQKTIFKKIFNCFLHIGTEHEKFRKKHPGSHPEVFCKKAFLEISQNFQETLRLTETLAQVFSCVE